MAQPHVLIKYKTCCLNNPVVTVATIASLDSHCSCAEIVSPPIGGSNFIHKQGLKIHKQKTLFLEIAITFAVIF